MDKSFVEFSQQLTPELYGKLKTALELGKWPNGNELSQQQRELCMQAVISYEAINLPEQERAGYLGQRCKTNGKGRSTGH